MEHTANAVAALDTLEFLSDTIPRTVTYKKIATERTKKASGELGAGQMTINGGRLERGAGGEEEEGDETIQEEGEDEERGEGVEGEEGGVEEEGEDGGESRQGSMDVEEIREQNGHRSVNGKRKLSEEEEEDEDMS